MWACSIILSDRVGQFSIGGWDLYVNMMLTSSFGHRLRRGLVLTEHCLYQLAVLCVSEILWLH